MSDEPVTHGEASASVTSGPGTPAEAGGVTGDFTPEEVEALRAMIFGSDEDEYDEYE